MAGFLRKFFGHQQDPSSTNDDSDLEKFSLLKHNASLRQRRG